MYPILFDHNRFDLNSHGIGDLVETMECEAQCTDEGEYEMQFKYPMNGELFSELKVNRFVVAKTDPHPARDSALQAFRIYNIEKNLDGTVTVSCQHVSYDLSCYIVKPFRVDPVPIYTPDGKQVTWNYYAYNAIKHMNTRGVGGKSEWQKYMVLPYPWSESEDGHPFTFSSNVEGYPHMQDDIFKFDEPRSARSLLLDGDDSIRGAWGGDLVFDNYKVYLLRPATNPPGDIDDTNKYNGGFDRNVTLEYGVDITDLTFEEDISEMITGILPYWRGNPNVENTSSGSTAYYDGSSSGSGGSSGGWHIRDKSKAIAGNDDEEKFVYGPICYISGEIQKHTIEPVDLSEFFQDREPSESELQSKGYEYIEANGIGVPEVTATVSYANLGQKLYLHDAVTIRHPDLGIDIKAKVTSYTYDVLAEQITEIEISNVKYRSKWKGLEDASRLKRGLIAPSRIASNSISGDKLASGSVSGTKIAEGGVDGGWHLRGGSVTTGALGTSVVTEDKVATDAVTTNKIKDGCITTSKVDAAFNNILTNALTTAKLSAALAEIEVTFAKEVNIGSKGSLNVYGPAEFAKGIDVTAGGLATNWLEITNGTETIAFTGAGYTKHLVLSDDNYVRWNEHLV